MNATLKAYWKQIDRKLYFCPTKINCSLKWLNYNNNSKDPALSTSGYTEMISTNQIKIFFIFVYILTMNYDLKQTDYIFFLTVASDTLIRAHIWMPWVGWSIAVQEISTYWSIHPRRNDIQLAICICSFFFTSQICYFESFLCLVSLLFSSFHGLCLPSVV